MLRLPLYMVKHSFGGSVRLPVEQFPQSAHNHVEKEIVSYARLVVARARPEMIVVAEKCMLRVFN
jgi:hypothetical protein